MLQKSHLIAVRNTTKFMSLWENLLFIPKNEQNKEVISVGKIQCFCLFRQTLLEFFCFKEKSAQLSRCHSETRFISSLKILYTLWGPPILSAIINRCFSPVVKWLECESDPLSPPSTEVQIKQVYTTTLPCIPSCNAQG